MKEKKEKTRQKLGIEGYKYDSSGDLPNEITLKEPVDVLILKDVVKGQKEYIIRLGSVDEDGTGECKILKNVEVKKKKGFFGKTTSIKEETVAEIRKGFITDYYGAINYSAEAIPIISGYLEKRYKWKPEDKEKAMFILQGKL
ncbi:MAG: hypothetical protein GTN40_01685 [Candidatus Aenigmarchaeota archaeon]|nr:hypothetical protein [Candidatus Aenigmarchaeota archaeon]